LQASDVAESILDVLALDRLSKLLTEAYWVVTIGGNMDAL